MFEGFEARLPVRHPVPPGVLAAEPCAAKKIRNDLLLSSLLGTHSCQQTLNWPTLSIARSAAYSADVGLRIYGLGTQAPEGAS